MGPPIGATIGPRLQFHQLSVEPLGGTDLGSFFGPLFGTAFSSNWVLLDLHCDIDMKPTSRAFRSITARTK